MTREELEAIRRLGIHIARKSFEHEYGSFEWSQLDRLAMELGRIAEWCVLPEAT